MALYILPASEQSGPVPIAYPDCAGGDEACERVDQLASLVKIGFVLWIV